MLQQTQSVAAPGFFAPEAPIEPLILRRYGSRVSEAPAGTWGFCSREQRYWMAT
jgi:hypothetical protein